MTREQHYCRETARRRSRGRLCRQHLRAASPRILPRRLAAEPMQQVRCRPARNQRPRSTCSMQTPIRLLPLAGSSGTPDICDTTLPSGFAGRMTSTSRPPSRQPEGAGRMRNGYATCAMQASLLASQRRRSSPTAASCTGSACSIHCRRGRRATGRRRKAERISVHEGRRRRPRALHRVLTAAPPRERRRSHHRHADVIGCAAVCCCPCSGGRCLLVQVYMPSRQSPAALVRLSSGLDPKEIIGL